MPFTLVDGGDGYCACQLCRRPVSGRYLVRLYDVVCVPCAEEIAAALESEHATREVVWVCKVCGAEFPNKGAWLRHQGTHKEEKE